MTIPRVSIVITTRNRREEVSLTIESCQQQTEPCEIIVFDDASPDGTSDWIRLHYPEVRLVVRSTPHDSCVNRNEGFRLARGEFVISLDDDSFFSHDDTARQVVAMFDQHPQAAILALAYVEPKSGGDRTMAGRPSHGTPMRGYVACAAAFRLSSVMAVNGYRDLLVHQGEERDLAIRILDQGESILYSETPPIVHLFSPKRNHARMNYYGFRNTILFCWMRIPFPECLFRAIVGTLQLLKYRFTFSTFAARIHALAAGWWGAIRYRRERQTVSRATWRSYRSLISHGALPLTKDERATYTVIAARQAASLDGSRESLSELEVTHPGSGASHD